MMKNGYWLLKAKSKMSSSQFIAELTPDGMAYIWPVTPRASSVALAPEADQDPDSLAIDGDFLENSGFYHSISDFMVHSQYTASAYHFFPLGEFDSIRSCRAAMD